MDPENVNASSLISVRLVIFLNFLSYLIELRVLCNNRVPVEKKAHKLEAPLQTIKENQK